MKKFIIEWQTSEPPVEEDPVDGEGHPIKPVGPPPTRK